MRNVELKYQALSANDNWLANHKWTCNINKSKKKQKIKKSLCLPSTYLLSYLPQNFPKYFEIISCLDRPCWL